MPRARMGKFMQSKKKENRQFSLDYVLSFRTGGANPFAIFESLQYLSQDGLRWAIVKIPYHSFLKTAYWFAVSSVAKSRAGMRCQVCNSGTGIQVHHRTYDNHGCEHSNMMDLVVLCSNCHGLFHGHVTIEYKPPTLPRGIRAKSTKVQRVIPHEPVDVQLPPGDPIVLTRELWNQCKTESGGFTNATLRAFGLEKPLIQGWPGRLLDKSYPRHVIQAAMEGRFNFNSGALKFNRVPLSQLIGEYSADV